MGQSIIPGFDAQQQIDRNYERELRDGQEFEDFVCDLLGSQFGLNFTTFRSQQAQYRRGESRCGIEIKLDKSFLRTRRLWIECLGRKYPWGTYVHEGINRSCWLYLIGCYDVIFVFSTRTLRRWRDKYKPTIRENNSRTSQGFLLPGEKASHIATAIIVKHPSEGWTIRDSYEDWQLGIPFEED